MPPTLRDILFGPVPAYQPRSGWPAPAAIVAALVVFIIATVVSTVAVGIMAKVLGVSIDMKGVGTGDALQIRILALALLIQQAAMILVTLFFADRFGHRAGPVLALDHWPRRTSVYLGSFGLMALLLVVLDIIGIAVGPQDIVNDLKPFAKMISSDSWWLTLLAVGVGAPLSEELLFRGFLFSALAQTRMGVLGASLLTTAMWTALHGNYSAFGIFEVAVIGLFLCWLLWRTGSLWVPIFCHAVYNTALTMLLSAVQLPA